MTVGTSIFLFLLPLAAAPIIFHLLMRRQRKTVKFSTDLFFESMKPRLSFHRKFREPLLLMARTLLLLFLLLALARLAFHHQEATQPGKDHRQCLSGGDGDSRRIRLARKRPRTRERGGAGHDSLTRFQLVGEIQKFFDI